MNKEENTTYFSFLHLSLSNSLGKGQTNFSLVNIFRVRRKIHKHKCLAFSLEVALKDVSQL